MQPKVAHELNDADRRILELLSEGRNLPQNLADDLDYSRQYVQNRLQMLKAADYVTNRGGGLYEITDDGRDEVGADDVEASLRARLQNALEDRDDAQARADRLRTELDDCQSQLVEENEISRGELVAALDEIEAAAERGNGSELQNALQRAREAIDDV